MQQKLGEAKKVWLSSVIVSTASFRCRVPAPSSASGRAALSFFWLLPACGPGNGQGPGNCALIDILNGGETGLWVVYCTALGPHQLMREQQAGAAWRSIS